MALKKKQLVIDDINYEVRELTMREIAPIMPRLTGDDALSAQFDMLTIAVSQEGVPMGDTVLDLGASAFTKLVEALMAVSGFDGGQGNG